MKFFESFEYQDKNIKIFEDLKNKLYLVLPFSRIEHIGASSIKGVISKGDLDIFIGVPKELFNKSIEIINQHGFHPKEGTFRSEQLCMFESDNPNEDVALQLVENGSEFEDFLQFRDLLINNPELRDQYNKMKNSCINLSHDEYREIKSKFVENILKQN